MAPGDGRERFGHPVRAPRAAVPSSFLRLSDVLSLVSSTTLAGLDPRHHLAHTRFRPFPSRAATHLLDAPFLPLPSRVHASGVQCHFICQHPLFSRTFPLSAPCRMFDARDAHYVECCRAHLNRSTHRASGIQCQLVSSSTFMLPGCTTLVDWYLRVTALVCLFTAVLRTSVSCPVSACPRPMLPTALGVLLVLRGTGVAWARHVCLRAPSLELGIVTSGPLSCLNRVTRRVRCAIYIVRIPALR